MRNKDHRAAAQEVEAALQTGNRPEPGFVMGELLRQQERWPEASKIYTEALRQDPGFTEAHTKLSFVLYSLGDADGALREARSALALEPENEEAHKNAGLAFLNLQSFTASEKEFTESLRIKQDYAQARLDQGLQCPGIAGVGKDFRSDRGIQAGTAIAPKRTPIRLELAAALEKNENWVEALEQYRQASLTDPNPDTESSYRTTVGGTDAGGPLQGPMSPRQ